MPVLQITWTARYGSQAGDIQPAEVQQEVVVSYLPLSHIAAQIYDLWTGIQWGAQVCFAEPDALKVSLPLPKRGSECVCRSTPECALVWGPCACTCERVSVRAPVHLLVRTLSAAVSMVYLTQQEGADGT